MKFFFVGMFFVFAWRVDGRRDIQALSNIAQKHSEVFRFLGAVKLFPPSNCLVIATFFNIILLQAGPIASGGAGHLLRGSGRDTFPPKASFQSRYLFPNKISRGVYPTTRPCTTLRGRKSRHFLVFNLGTAKSDSGVRSVSVCRTVSSLPSQELTQQNSQHLYF